jgi:tRNA-specific 2-thiouridylase
MSGGIDSSVVAALLQLAGFEVVGISMQLFDKRAQPTGAESSGRCCTLDDFQDARRIATQLGFAHYVMNFEHQFKREVITPFIDSYLAGETPSPCILCNQHLKFDALLKAADELGARFVATGHYARILFDEHGYHLLKAEDPRKDQSYFLFSHTQGTLARTLFPLERLLKHQVRQIAQQLGLHLANKPESQEICFVPQDRYVEFIEASGTLGVQGQVGEIRHVDGRLLGVHQGYWRFTIGQRKGIGIAHLRPLYVVRIDPEKNLVWVGEDECLFECSLEARQATWCLGNPCPERVESAKLRSRSPEVPAQVERLDGDRVKVLFPAPQRAITPGQAVVFYRGEEVLGGGWITRIR